MTLTCDICNRESDGSSKRYVMGQLRGVACPTCWPVLMALYGLDIPADVLVDLPTDEGAVGQTLEFIYDRLMARRMRALADQVADRGMALFESVTKCADCACGAEIALEGGRWYATRIETFDHVHYPIGTVPSASVEFAGWSTPGVAL
jgi:hypothetical protein